MNAARTSLLFLFVSLACAPDALATQPEKQTQKPPASVAPGAMTEMASPPADAIVLFDGTGLDKWEKLGGGSPGWKVTAPSKGEPGGFVEVVPGAGNIRTRQEFGNVQIHVEFREPSDGGEGQGRGNSGVYIQSRYEVQVLDSFKSETYPNGQCGAIYGQHVPLVNACREPGQWQTYDIVFHGAKFNEKGERTSMARVTVLHNGILIQDNVEIDGPTGAAAATTDSPGPGPLMLQEHGNKVQYRNVWLRELAK